MTTPASSGSATVDFELFPRQRFDSSYATMRTLATEVERFYAAAQVFIDRKSLPEYSPKNYKAEGHPELPYELSVALRIPQAFYQTWVSQGLKVNHPVEPEARLPFEALLRAQSLTLVDEVERLLSIDTSSQRQVTGTHREDTIDLIHGTWRVLHSTVQDLYIMAVLFPDSLTQGPRGNIYFIDGDVDACITRNLDGRKDLTDKGSLRDFGRLYQFHLYRDLKPARYAGNPQFYVPREVLLK